MAGSNSRAISELDCAKPFSTLDVVSNMLMVRRKSKMKESRRFFGLLLGRIRLGSKNGRFFELSEANVRVKSSLSSTVRLLGMYTVDEHASSSRMLPLGVVVCHAPPTLQLSTMSFTTKRFHLSWFIDISSSKSQSSEWEISLADVRLRSRGRAQPR